MKIYISLPMHGHTEEDVRKRAERGCKYVEDTMRSPAFTNYAQFSHVNCDNVEVVTPLMVAERVNAKVAHYGKYPADVEYLLADLREIAESVLVVVLDGWKDSRGCLTEVAFAQAHGIGVVHLSEQAMSCREVLTSGELDKMPMAGLSKNLLFAFQSRFYDMMAELRMQQPTAVRLGQKEGDLPY